MVDLAFFGGDWRLSRRVQDARAGEVRQFEGRAVFSADGEGLLCVEEGRWTGGAWDGLSGVRRSLWRAGEDGRIVVLFGDGRAFHDFDPGGGGEAVHLCDPDRYVVSYGFDGDEWEAVWRVTGPLKDYVMQSRYRRG